MKVRVYFHSFTTRELATKWMEEQYAKYEESQVVTSNFAEDNDSVTAYITIKVGENSKNIEG